MRVRDRRLDRIRLRLRSLHSVGLLSALVVASGCGGPSLSETVAVAGKVTYNGKPVVNGSVFFNPEGSGNMASGELQGDGTFKLTTFQKNDGARPGKYKITLFVNPPADSGGGLPGREFEGQKPPIPAKYFDAATTDLVVTITAREDNLELQLKD